MGRVVAWATLVLVVVAVLTVVDVYAQTPTPVQEVAPVSLTPVTDALAALADDFHLLAVAVWTATGLLCALLVATLLGRA